MNMKDHMLAALREQFDQWEELLASMTVEQLTTPQLPSELSTKDVVAHVMAWQQISIARVEAAVLNKEPVFPTWPPQFDLATEDDVDGINAWFYKTHHDHSWATVYQEWKAGFLRFLKVGGEVAERDLLDSERYSWLNGYPLAFILMGSYEHHQEHLDELRVWLQQQKNATTAA